MSEKKLEKEHQLFIVQQFAVFERPKSVQKQLKEIYGIEISLPGIQHYQITSKELSKELKIQLSVGKTLDEGTGIVVDADNGRLHYDNTLETRLSRLQSALRSSVYHVLMGERL